MTVDAGRLPLPVLLVHGGAGTYERADSPAVVAGIAEGLRGALAAGWPALAAGEALAAAVAAVSFLERHGGFNAGRGSVRTTAGTVEMDAAVMDSAGRAAGVACLRERSAIQAAAALHAAGGPVLLAGEGAHGFAVGHAVPVLAAAAEPVNDLPSLSAEGTVGAVAVAADGSLAAATSTGGRAGQPPGRVGDSPVPGAGTWVGRAAVSATGVGEALLLAGFARLVGDSAAPLPEALAAALDEVGRWGGDGGGIAVDAAGRFAAGFSTRAMARGCRSSAGESVVVLDGALGG